MIGYKHDQTLYDFSIIDMRHSIHISHSIHETHVNRVKYQRHDDIIMSNDWKIAIIFVISVVGLLCGVAVAQYISGSNDGVAVAQYISGSNDGVADAQKHITKACKLLPNLDSMYCDGYHAVNH